MTCSEAWRNEKLIVGHAPKITTTLLPNMPIWIIFKQKNDLIIFCSVNDQDMFCKNDSYWHLWRMWFYVVCRKQKWRVVMCDDMTNYLSGMFHRYQAHLFQRCQYGSFHVQKWSILASLIEVPLISVNNSWVRVNPFVTLYCTSLIRTRYTFQPVLPKMPIWIIFMQKWSNKFLYRKWWRHFTKETIHIDIIFECGLYPTLV